MRKYCSGCDAMLDVSAFRKCASKRDGLQSRCRDCQSAHARAARRADPERTRARDKVNNARLQRNRRLQHRYGISLGEFAELLEAQGGVCANPGCDVAHSPERPLCVDHDHSCCPGRSCGRCVRGLLCSPCNQALGLLQDEPKRLLGLADYLEGR